MKVYPYQGRNLTILQVNKLTGFPLHELHRRLVERGMTVEEALAEPVGKPSKAELLRRLTVAREAPATPKGPPQILPTYTYDGRTMTLGGWARATGIKRGTLRSRLTRFEWPIERALTTPVGTSRKPQVKASPTPLGRQPHLYLYGGQRLPMREIARLAGVSLRTAYNRRSGHRVLEGGTRRERNAGIIARMLEAFHETQKPLQTGGYCQTFPGDEGTGVGTHEIHCEGTSA